MRITLKQSTILSIITDELAAKRFHQWLGWCIEGLGQDIKLISITGTRLVSQRTGLVPIFDTTG